MSASSVRLLTSRESSRSAKSVNDANFRLRRSSRIDLAAASPTPLMAARPNRIDDADAAKLYDDSLMSGGSTAMPDSWQSPSTFTMPSVEPISADRFAPKKSTG